MNLGRSVCRRELAAASWRILDVKTTPLRGDRAGPIFTDCVHSLERDRAPLLRSDLPITGGMQAEVEAQERIQTSAGWAKALGGLKLSKRL